jgi:hypothetical protein
MKQITHVVTIVRDPNRSERTIFRLSAWPRTRRRNKSSTPGKYISTHWAASAPVGPGLASDSLMATDRFIRRFSQNSLNAMPIFSFWA